MVYWRPGRVLSQCASLLVAGLALLGTHAAWGDEVLALNQQGQPPYTETWSDMLQRDSRWRADVAAGRAPAPPPVRRIHEQKAVRHPDLTPPCPPTPVELLSDLSIGSVQAPAGSQSPQGLAYGFLGLNLEETTALGLGWIPPDTSGAIGPNHFVQIVNGAVAIYDRAGVRLSAVTDASFFALTSGGVNYPRNGSFDPRILYDRQCGRWFLCELEFGNQYYDWGWQYESNNIMLAISRTSDPTGVWDKYRLPVGIAQSGTTHYFNDFETMGLDTNGLYFAFRVFPSVGDTSYRLAVTRRASLIAAQPYLGTMWILSGQTDMFATPMPAHNHDVVASTGAEWVVGGSPTSRGPVLLRTISWSTSGLPQFGAIQTVSSYAYGAPVNAPAMGSTTDICTNDDRLQGAVIRDSRLWTSRTVTLGISTYDRTGVQVMAIDVGGASPAVAVNATKWDSTSTTNPISYYYPSVVPTGQGHAVLGYSVSGGSRYVTAVSTGRLAGYSSSALGTSVILQDGLNSYTALDSIGRNRWGDYSFSSLDPNDDMSVWTIQEYAHSTANKWGTCIAKLLAPAPVITAASGTGIRGRTKQALDVTGVQFFDPGAGFASRLSARLDGGARNATDVAGVTYNGPTSVSLAVDIHTEASLGTRSLVLINPDGQLATRTDAYTVVATTAMEVGNVSGQRGQTVSLTATVNDTTIGLPVKGLTVEFGLDGQSLGSAVTDATGRARVTYLMPEDPPATSRLVAAFAGTDVYVSSRTQATLSLIRNTTSAYIAAPGTTASGAYLRLYTYLKRTVDSKVLPFRPVSFVVNGLSAGSAVTDSNGYAEILYLLPAATPAGTVPIKVAFAGDTNNAGCTGSGTATISTGSQVSIYSNSPTGGRGSRLALYAYLWRTSDHAMIADRTIIFSVDGLVVGSARTDGNGYARLTWQVPSAMPAGAHDMQAKFMGDAWWRAISRTTTVTTTDRFGVSISHPSRSGVAGLPVRLYAYLWQSLDGAMLASRTLTFRVDGAEVGSSTTNASGYAELLYTIPAGTAAGKHTTRASFAGDATFDAGSADTTLTVAAKDTLSWFVANATGARGTAVTLYAYVKSGTTGGPVEGKSIAFAVDGVAVGQSVTNGAGYAAWRYTVPPGAASGSHPVLASFAGDATTNPGSKGAVLSVP